MKTPLPKGSEDMTPKPKPSAVTVATIACDLERAVTASKEVLLASIVLLSLALAQMAALAQSANALFLNQNPAPANTAPGVMLFNGHAGQVSGAGTPTDGTAWLVGSAFGQPAVSELFWDDTPEQLPDYVLGEIPTLLALHGGAVLFTVRSEELGPGAVFTFQFDSTTPTPQGQLLLDATTGRFAYIPAPSDKLPFNILITASQGGQTDVQLVEIQPRALLPQEEDLVRPGRAMPAEDSPTYVVRSEILSDASEFFNGNSRQTREATVSGKVVVVENGNPNRLWQSYDSVLDLKSLTIYAEQVVVRSAWHLPSTRVTIYARVVRYEGSGRIEQAYGVQVVDGDFEWLTPHALRAGVAYTKDLYLYGYRQDARNLLSDYYEKLIALEESTRWPGLEDASRLEFGQIGGEIAELLHRLDSNLDYFGHPAGWVPNLSFEANLGFFSSEAESAIRILYLAYWLGNVASTIQQKADGMANSRSRLAADFNSLTNELDAAQLRLTELEGKSSIVESNVSRLQTALANRVEELRRMAEQAAAKLAKKKKRNRWRKVLKQVGGILAVSPVGAPILNAIGTGLTLAADIHQPRDLLNLDRAGQLLSVARAFNKAAFKESVASIKDFLRPLDPGRIGRNGWSNYIHGVSVVHRNFTYKLRENQSRLKPTEAADADVQASLAEAKAENPELNQRFGDAQADGLMDQIAAAAGELKQLNSDITDALQQMGNLTGEIHRHVLAVDSMNRDVSAQNAILDHRAIVHLKEMERRAMERLQKYQYYLAKSYEYRFLEPYPGELNLNPIFEAMVRIAQTSQALGLLSAAEFESLKALYENELAEVTYAVIERFQQNPPARSTPVTLSLSPSELEDLNSGEPVHINMVERYRVPVNREDMRINDIDLTSFTMVVDGPSEPNVTISLFLAHAGVSKVRSVTNDFYFRHDQQRPVSPFLWEVDYDSNTGEKTPIVPSPADTNLLQYLLALRGVPTTSPNVLLFTRPGVWADMQLMRIDWPFELPNYTITNLTIRMSYDFRSKPNNLVALDVFASDTRIAPYIILDRTDQRGRQDGIGRFYRTYPKGVTITVTAPTAFGVWRFDRWVDAFGRNLPGGLGASHVLTLTLNDNWAIQARYVNTDLDEDGLPDDWEVSFYGSISASPADDTDEDGWGSFLEFLNESHPLLWDTDGDGMSDGAEGVAGTDAIDSASTLRLDTLPQSDGTVHLRWASVAGITYVVEMTRQLGATPWQQIATVTATGSVTSVRVGLGQRSGFYRLRVVDRFSLLLRAPVFEADGMIRLDWSSVPGKTYAVEKTARIGLAEWQTVETVTATGSAASLKIPVAGLQGFYRLRIVGE